MRISAKCPACGNVNQVESSDVGKKIRCAGCGRSATIAAPKGAAVPTGAPAGVVKFVCPSCGQKLSTKLELAGKKIRCIGCGAGVRVPGGVATTAGDAASPRPHALAGSSQTTSTSQPISGEQMRAHADSEVDGDSGDSYALCEIETPEEPSRFGGEPELPGRSQSIAQPDQQTTEQESARTPANGSKVKKKKRKWKKLKVGLFDARETLLLFATVIGIVALLAFCAWAYPDFRFELGAALCLLGFIVYILGILSMQQVVSEEGSLQALALKFFPPYQWWFIVRNWTDAKDFVAIFAAGILIMAIGGAIMSSTSSVFKEEVTARTLQEEQKKLRRNAPPPVLKKATVEKTPSQQP